MYDAVAGRERLTFEPAGLVARRLGVSEAWLMREAAEGRVPALQAGRSVLFHYPTLRRALLRRVAAIADRLAEAGDAPGGASRHDEVVR
jgi:hypothetical protein